MARESGLSQTAVSRIWRAFGLQPHRQETFKLSTDPQFVAKTRDIVGLYLDPPTKAMVLCVDEKSQIQALDRTQPILPLAPGIAERRTQVEQPIKSLLEKARTPFRYRLRRDAKRGGYDFVAGATGAAQNDARAQGERLSCLAPTRPGLQLLAFRFTQHHLRFRSTSHRASVVSNQLYDGQRSDQ